MTDSRSLPDLPNKPGKTNWVEKAGGLPSFINRIAKHLFSEQGYSEQRAIATAVSQAKKVCATGRTFGGKVAVSPAARRRYCQAVAQWEAKKAKSHVQSSEVEPSLTDLISLAEAAERRLVLIQESCGGEAGLHLLVEREFGVQKRRARAEKRSAVEEGVNEELDLLAEETMDLLALIEAINLPRHRDGKWTNVLARVQRLSRGHEQMMAELAAAGHAGGG